MKEARIEESEDGETHGRVTRRRDDGKTKEEERNETEKKKEGVQERR